MVIDGEGKRNGRAGRCLAVHQQFEPPWLQRIEPGICRERKNRRMVEGPYAVMAAGADALVLAAGELVRLVTLNHPEAIEPVCAYKIINKIIRAFRGDKDLPGGKDHAFAARTEIIRVAAAEDVLANGSRRREPGINIDISVIWIGERNTKLSAHNISFAKRCSDVVAGDDLMDDRALGEEIAP